MECVSWPSLKMETYASKLSPLGHRYTDLDMTAVLEDTLLAVTWMNGRIQVSESRRITSAMTRSLTRMRLTPEKADVFFAVLACMIVPPFPYSNPSSPSFLATRSEASTRIRPTSDWNRPTAVAREKLPPARPFS